MIFQKAELFFESVKSVSISGFLPRKIILKQNFSLFCGVLASGVSSVLRCAS